MIVASLVLALFATTAPADDGSSSDAAVRAYREGRHADAARVFRGLLESCVGGDPRLLFNLGNCAFRAGDHAEAALRYRQVLARRPGDDGARFNLRLAERRLGLDEVRPGLLERLDTRLDASPASGAWIAALLQLLGLVGLAVGRGRLSRGIGVLLLAGGLALAVRGASLRDPVGRARASSDAVVLTPDLPLRPAPHDEVPATRRLRAGEVVEVVESSDRWARVEDVRGGVGWLRTDGIGRVDGSDDPTLAGRVSSARR
ncbi:MAG: SH3 domain-containing protein [Planctomycetota bacterium JB042]